MLIPLGVLTVGAVAAGFVFHHAFIDAEHGAAFWNGSLFFNAHLMHEMHEVPLWVKLASTVAMLIGLLTAILMYLVNASLPAKLASALSPLYQFFLNKWYFDELYNHIFVKPSFALGRFFWKVGDEGTINRFGPDGAAVLVTSGSRVAMKLQSGFLYSYALVMLLGLVAALTWLMVR